jgi:hypothetical protein
MLRVVCNSIIGLLGFSSFTFAVDPLAAGMIKGSMKSVERDNLPWFLGEY